MNAIFDNAVPEELKSKSQDKAPAVTSTTTIVNETEKPFTMKEKDTFFLEKRSNIYDNDEFDIFHRENIDLSRIHKGKKYVNDLVNNIDSFLIYFQNTRFTIRS